MNLRVDQGTVHAIIGPNGAGKSTLLNAIIGKLIPDNGEINFGGASMLGAASPDQPIGYFSRIPNAGNLWRVDASRKHDDSVAGPP